MITYFAYSIIHFEKVFWSVSKTYLIKRHPDELSKKIISGFDTASLLCYGISLYVCGVLGDNYNQRKVLTLGMSGMATCYMLLSLLGFFDVTHQAPFYIVLMLIGSFNAFLPPSMISIVGNWFAKKQRGLIVGVWMSCNNFGNIVGMQLAALLTSFVGDQWQYLMVTVSALALLFAFLIFFFVHPDPKEIGIQIEDLDENEMLIEAAMDDKEVFSKMVEVERKSIRLSTKEVVDEVKHSQTYKKIRLSVRG